MIKHWREYFTVIDLRSWACVSYQKEDCNLISVDKHLAGRKLQVPKGFFLQRKAQKDQVALSWRQKNPINRVENLNYEEHKLVGTLCWLLPSLGVFRSRCNAFLNDPVSSIQREVLVTSWASWKAACVLWVCEYQESWFKPGLSGVILCVWAWPEVKIWFVCWSGLKIPMASENKTANPGSMFPSPWRTQLQASHDKLCIFKGFWLSLCKLGKRLKRT